MNIRRRQVLKTLGALTCLAMPGRTQPARAASPAEALVGGDYCAAGIPSRPLVLPTGDGRFARLAPDGAPLTMRASTIAGTAGPWTQGFAVEHRGTRFVNPTLVFKRGERVRIDFENALEEPTIVHWHGLAVDTHNDGAAVPPVAPRERYSYAFDVRDRGSLYWYHPHPHGLTAGQAYRGMFGLIEVEDDDERALRTALDLVPGKSEIPLILQDRRGADAAVDEVAVVGDGERGLAAVGLARDGDPPAIDQTGEEAPADAAGIEHPGDHDAHVPGQYRRGSRIRAEPSRLRGRRLDDGGVFQRSWMPLHGAA